MNEKITCIFCEKKSLATDEHIVPEFIGGSLIIRDVCKKCNDNMGSDFEGPLSNNLIFRLPRHLNNIQGKSEELINPFPNVGLTTDGRKVKLDNNFNPRLITEPKKKRLESGDLEVQLTVDASNKDEIPKMLESIIRRHAKAEWPDMNESEIENLVVKSLSSIPTDLQINSSNPIIKYSESLNLKQLCLLMMKIAYEIAFHHHGEKIFSDSYYAKLRDEIHTRNINPNFMGQLLIDPDPFSKLEVPEKSHCVILCENICYVRLFDLTSMIPVLDINSDYRLTTEDWIIYFFDYVNLKYIKQNFVLYFSEKGG